MNGVTPTAAEVKAAVRAATGQQPATLLLAGGRLVNVFTNEVQAADVLVMGRLVAGVFDPGDGHAQERRANAVEVYDLHGALITPGLIDGHVHIESSLVDATEYARGVIPRGVTGVVCDPHEIANVSGEAGVRWLLEASEELPLDVWVSVPSCVPSSPFETAGAEFGKREMRRLLDHPRVVAVAELMSYPEVVAADDVTLAKAYLGDELGLPVEGHAPGLTGADLQAYLASGISSDHESPNLEEGQEKLRAGMFLMVREGSVTRDLDALMPLVDERHGDRIGFVTDDRLPHDLLTEGALDLHVRRAVEAGVNPAYALRCASLNTALHYRLPRRGAVAAGYFADILIVEDFAEFKPKHVFKEGVRVAGDLELLPGAFPEATERDDRVVMNTVDLSRVTDNSFKIEHQGADVLSIRVLPNTIVTESEVVKPKVEGGLVVADPERDLLKLACAERHGKHGGVGLGLVQGFGLKRGALGSSVGHDHHNVMLLGANDADMLVAARRLEELGGGFVAVEDGEVIAELPLPLAGLMTSLSLVETEDALSALDAAAVKLGCTLPSPYMALSFVGLAVVPEVRLTDLGLVDVPAGKVVPLAVGADVPAAGDV